MLLKFWQGKTSVKILIAWVVGAIVAFGWAGDARLVATPINPIVFKQQFDEAKKNADVVAQVRVLSAVCTESAGGNVTLQVALQVLDAEKGPVKKNEIVVVSHKVTLPAGPGPRAYGYMAATRQFPFTPGVKGSAALNWDKQHRCYAVVAGWVPEPNGASIPSEVGKAFTAGDGAQRR